MKMEQKSKNYIQWNKKEIRKQILYFRHQQIFFLLFLNAASKKILCGTGTITGYPIEK